LNIATEEESPAASAVVNGKLQLAASQLSETQEKLNEMTERAKGATEARRGMEEEMVPLRARHAALEKQVI